MIVYLHLSLTTINLQSIKVVYREHHKPGPKPSSKRQQTEDGSSSPATTTAMSMPGLSSVASPPATAPITMSIPGPSSAAPSPATIPSAMSMPGSSSAASFSSTPSLPIYDAPTYTVEQPAPSGPRHTIKVNMVKTYVSSIVDYHVFQKEQDHYLAHRPSLRGPLVCALLDYLAY